MGSFVVGFLLLVIVALAVKSAVHRIRHGSACCGERDAPEKKVRPADKNKSHYPYECILVVDGMCCSNCVRRVENALNSVDGFWAKANLEKKSVNVLSKTQAEASFFEKRIGEVGYTVLSVSQWRKS